jgi:probable rRNA maturation factor
MLQISFMNDQARVNVDGVRLRDAVRGVLAAEKVKRAEISIAVVDDVKMHELNLRYLQHDYATDVLSFRLDELEEGQEGPLEGEIIVSIDTAEREAEDYGWRREDELLLYVIHGALHLVGYDDEEVPDRLAMRQAEAKHLARFGLNARHDDPLADPHAPARSTDST